MKKFKNYYPLFILIVVYISGVWFSYSYFPLETKINILISFVTFLVGILVVYIYIKQKDDTKRDAAKIILQEIRRAEDIISDYKQGEGGYQFAKKIIATNNWSKNIHLFVGDLDNDELDRISNLYSTGEYLDTLIKEISDYTFKKEIDPANISISNTPMMLPAPTQDAQPMQQSQTINLDIAQNYQQKIKLLDIKKIEPPWKHRLDLITFKLEPVYHSTITLKLKKIAQIK